VRLRLNSAFAAEGRDLQRIKRVATGLLIFATVMCVAAVLLTPRYPLFAYVAATCEAAMVGALADWYAVVVLFRRPLNLALPHTAIIPQNKARIARNLGIFIQEQFLSASALASKVKEIDPAARLAAWLQKPANSFFLASNAARLISYVLASLDDRRIRDFLHREVTTRLQELDVATLTGRALDALTENNRHQALLDHALGALRNFLSRAEARNYLAGEISTQWSLARWIAESLRLDEIVAANVLKFVVAKLDEIRADPDHELRKQFDIVVQQVIERLKTDPIMRARAGQIRDDALQSAVIAEYLNDAWAKLKTWFDQDLLHEESAVIHELGALIKNLGAQLGSDSGTREWINDKILRAVPSLVHEHRETVGDFIERQVNTWKDDKLVYELERNIGVDLQHIRINGTIVGAIAGLLIYSATRLLVNG
jgi:uncharacterized membrane-anchored protein YjiN (DUF445 family)